MPPSKRIISISDFHLTSGINDATGVWSPTEDFFGDKSFAEFLGHYTHDGVPTTLVFNGDLFDFLQVLEYPDEWLEERKTAKRESAWHKLWTKSRPDHKVYEITSNWKGATFTYSIPRAEINPTYGLRCTEESTRFLAGKIVEGHVPLFTAIVDFISRDGNSVIILKGNHDIQLFWGGVQDELHARIERLAPPDMRALVRERIIFKPWFHYEPGLVWIEHGNQYEYTTSFKNFLYPYLSFNHNGVSKQIELDLSSFLVRYLTNRVEVINPLADNVRPLARYWDWMWKTHPLMFVQTLGIGVRFVISAFAKGTRMRTSHNSEAYRQIEKQNRALIRDEAAKCGPSGTDAAQFEQHLLAFDARKAEPTLDRGAFRFLWMMMRNPIKGILVLLLAKFLLDYALPPVKHWLRDSIALPATWTWLHWLSNLMWGLGIIHVVLLAIMVLLLILLRQYIRSKNPSDDDTLYGNPVKQLREHAEVIASTLNVKYVTMGHTHYTDIQALPNDSRYFNSGSWMAILAEDERLYREVRQYTFLLIEDREAKLLCWDTARGRPKDVVVMNTACPPLADENSLLQFFIRNVRQR